MKHILIIEDERPINDLMELNLRLAGYRVTQVFDRRSALDALSAGTFDLMLLKVLMFLNLKHSAQGLTSGVFSAVMDGQPICIRVDGCCVSVGRDALPDAAVLELIRAGRLFPLPLFRYAVDCF